MTVLAFLEIEEPIERALLVGIERPDDPWPASSSLEELARLVDTIGAQVVATTTQKLRTPNPKTFVGTGKAQEIASLCEELEIDVVIFDDELSPSQQSNLEHCVARNVKIIDRTALILDIFALHAITKEGRLQVRLAQNEYLYPRLRGMWAHLASNRMGGGVGSRFGEGESQLEVDRRMIRKRITSIKHELKKLDRVREVQRSSRNRSGIYKGALAGYTNAGKSSLINALTNADVLSMDKLFATLESTTRKLELEEGREIVLTDTIGFIRKLPHTLVESFKSTLDEINSADLILHVIDSSSFELDHQVATVEEVLEEIQADRIPRLEVYNKIDALAPEELEHLKRLKPQAVFVSALTGEGLDELKERISCMSASRDDLMDLLIPYERGDLVSLAHRRMRIISEEHTDEGTKLRVYVPREFTHLFESYVLPFRYV